MANKSINPSASETTSNKSEIPDSECKHISEIAEHMEEIGQDMPEADPIDGKKPRK